MNIATAITTAPREEYWLGRCVESCARAGLPEPYFVFAEPESLVTESTKPHVLTLQNPTRLGAFGNWLQALDDTVQLAPAADAVLVVQDDTILCRDAGRWLSRVLWPSEQCGCVCVYTSRGYHGYTKRGLHKLPEQLYADLWGACAVAFPRGVARQIVAYAAENEWRGHATATVREPNKKCAIDAFIGVAVQALDREVWICNPSLARHENTCSTLGHGQSIGRRKALDYQGDHISPFQLFGGKP